MHQRTDSGIGVGAQSTLGGHHIFGRKICIKNQQNVRILNDFCPKNARILHNDCPNNIFPDIRGPVSYAYASPSRGLIVVFGGRPNTSMTPRVQYLRGIKQ